MLSTLSRLAPTVAALLLLMIPAMPAHAQIYVDKGAGGANDGSSWTDAFTDLQTAIDDATGNDEIWVAQGVYTPDPDGTDDTQSFTITGDQNGLEIYGGFEGGESSRSERAPADHRVVLSGDVDGNDNTNSEGATPTAADINGANSNHVVFLDGDRSTNPNITSATVLDGITISGGQDESLGGGLYCDGSDGGVCSPTLRDMIFAGNYAGGFGGALYNNGRASGTSSPTIVGVVFTGNETNNNGGALYNNGNEDGESRPDITNVVFADNSAAGEGGAIFNNARASGTSSPTITNAVFVGNSADDGGGAIYNSGRDDGKSNPTITNATFADNTTSGSGGALHNNGTLSGTATPQLTNTILWGNSAATSGNEIHNNSASSTISHSIVQGGNAGIANGTGFGDGTNNLDQDPLLIAPDDPAGRDGSFGTRDDGGNVVAATSPALDAGSNSAVPSGVSTDITGAARMQDRDGDGNATVNIGAYEVEEPARTLYVDGAAGSGDGTSWSTPYTDLQTALEDATSNDEIWIAEGIYKPDGEDDSFRITGNIDGVEVYGGFESGDVFADRAPREHRTILSGDLNADDTDPDGDGIVEDADPDQDGTAENLSGPNATHVLVLDGGDGTDANVDANVTSATVVDGVVVTAGQATGSPNLNGSGLYCDGEGSGNECSPTLTGVVFAGNAASGNGGAVYNRGNESNVSSPTITNAVFRGNRSGASGGAMYIRESSLQVTNAVFVANTAEANGGAVNNVGPSSPVFTNVTFTANSAGGNGGAILNDGISGALNLQITNAILWGNSAGESGDEMENINTSPTLAHTIIEGGVNGSGVAGDNNTDGGGNLDQDPQFADSGDPFGLDNTYATADDGVNVGTGSPALDAGDNAAIPSGVSADITGTDRTLDRDDDGTATVNIGAYEVIFASSPIATTGSARNVEGTTADFTGTVNPKGLETTVRAQVYPTADPSVLRTVTAAASPFTGTTSQNVTVSLTGLQPSTEYKAQLSATNAKGEGEGQLVTFTTSAGYSRTIAGQDGTGNDAGWRMLALPAAGKTRVPLGDDVDFSVRTEEILYRWDGSSQSWSAQTSSSDNLPRGTGLMLYLFDDSGEEIDSEGLPLAVSAGPEDQSADKTVSGLDQSGTFHLLGNPFGKAFDLGSLAGPSGSDLAASGFQATVQVWDPAQGSYVQITQGDSGDDLPAWQGFFVERTTSGSGDTELTFAASGKQDSNGSLIGSNAASPVLAGKTSEDSRDKRADPSQAKASAPHAEVPLELELQTDDGVGSPPSPSGKASDTETSAVAKANTTTETRVDRAVYWIDGRAASGYDAYEGRDLAPPTGGASGGSYVSLAFPIEKERTLTQRAQAAVPYPSDGLIDRTVPLSAAGIGTSGTATIRWPEDQNEDIPDDWSVTLTDTQNGEKTDLRTSDYTFDLSSGTNLSDPSDARFRLTVQDNAVPVELTRFDGTTVENENDGLSQDAVRLTWKTASETNNAGFEVQRRAKNSPTSGWQKIGFRESQAEGGTASEPLSYRFTDENVPYTADSISYRLRQVDTDGGATLTDPVTIARSGPERLRLLGTFPNPARQRATVRYGVPESTEGDVRLRLYDVLGRQVRTVAATKEAGRHEARLDVDGLSSGVYILRLRSSGEAVTRKLTVIR